MSARVLIHGAAGRMGRALADAVRASADLQLAAAIDRPDHPEIGREIAPGIKLTADAAGALAGCDVAIDFSTADALLSNFKQYTSRRLPAVIGTTGWHTHVDQLRAEAQKAGIGSAAGIVLYSSHVTLPRMSTACST